MGWTKRDEAVQTVEGQRRAMMRSISRRLRSEASTPNQKLQAVADFKLWYPITPPRPEDPDPGSVNKILRGLLKEFNGYLVWRDQ